MKVSVDNLLAVVDFEETRPPPQRAMGWNQSSKTL